MSDQDAGHALAEAILALASAGGPYFVGGSMASVLLGDVRTTLDVCDSLELAILRAGNPLVVEG